MSDSILQSSTSPDTSFSQKREETPNSCYFSFYSRGNDKEFDDYLSEENSAFFLPRNLLNIKMIQSTSFLRLEAQRWPLPQHRLFQLLPLDPLLAQYP